MNNHYVDSTHYYTDTIHQGEQTDTVTSRFQILPYLVKKTNQIFFLQKITLNQTHPRPLSFQEKGESLSLIHI